MRAISMRSAAKIAGVPYPTVATWIEQGLIRPQEYIGIQGNRVKLTAKDVNELCYLAKLRGLLSMQALKKALNYLRKLGYNPLSTGYFAVLGGPPSRRRLIKIDNGEAVELIGKHKGQLLLIPLWNGEAET